MQLECKNCHQLLNLPDDKLPIGRPFSFSCPYCKDKNTAMVEAQNNPSSQPEDGQLPYLAQDSAPGGNQPADPHQTTAPVPPTPLRAPKSHDDAYSAADIPAPSFSTDDDEFSASKLSLKQLLNGEVDERPKALIVYDDLDVAEKLEHKVEALGFQVFVAMNMRDAAKQLKFTNFAIVLIQEDYYGASLSSNHLLRSIQGMDGAARRGMLVILISPNMTTLDDLLAFSYSLDAIINTSELDNVERILISTVGRARKFYAIYREILAEQGLD